MGQQPVSDICHVCVCGGAKQQQKKKFIAISFPSFICRATHDVDYMSIHIYIYVHCYIYISVSVIKLTPFNQLYSRSLTKHTLPNTHQNFYNSNTHFRMYIRVIYMWQWVYKQTFLRHLYTNFRVSVFGHKQEYSRRNDVSDS